MRKYLFINSVFLFIFWLFSIFLNFHFLTPVKAENPQYFRVLEENIMLYRTTENLEDIENIFFELPKSYFVKQIATISENLIQVEYQGVTGFVKSNEVTPVYSTPVTPYFYQNLKVVSTANPVVYSAPSTTSKYLGNIPFNANEVTCLGSITNGNDTWYYCKYSSYEQGQLIGYIHSKLITEITPYTENTEEVLVEPVENASANIIAPELKSQSNLLLIFILSLFGILLLILVLKPKRNKQNKQAKRQISNLTKLSLPNQNNDNELNF